MGDQQSHFAGGEFGEALKDFKFTAGIERRGGLVEDQQLGIAQIGAREGHLLPFAAREIDAAFETPAEHLIVSAGELCNHALGKALLRGVLNLLGWSGERSMRPTAMFSRAVIS